MSYDRRELLLKILVERYIRDGQPVASKTLANDVMLRASPATIRNIMADLENRGYIQSPHTSSGRVPTDQGYRLFVDQLMTACPSYHQDFSGMEDKLDRNKSASELIDTTSHLLSDLTQLAGLVMVPRKNQYLLRQVEFLPLSESRVLVVLVLNEQEVENRIVEVDAEYSEVELKQAANYLNHHYVGRPLDDISKDLLLNLEKEKAEIDQLMATTLDVATKALEVPEQEDFVVAGETNLVNAADLADLERLKELFNAFTKKREILHVLNQCVSASGVNLFIGQESGYESLIDYSVVTAPYSAGDGVVGVLAVVGPTRMDYQKVIKAVDVTAKLLGIALNHSS